MGLRPPPLYAELYAERRLERLIDGCADSTDISSVSDNTHLRLRGAAAHGFGFIAERLHANSDEYGIGRELDRITGPGILAYYLVVKDLCETEFIVDGDILSLKNRWELAGYGFRAFEERRHCVFAVEELDDSNVFSCPFKVDSRFKPHRPGADDNDPVANGRFAHLRVRRPAHMRFIDSGKIGDDRFRSDSDYKRVIFFFVEDFFSRFGIKKDFRGRLFSLAYKPI